jgi:hypothetical protein
MCHVKHRSGKGVNGLPGVVHPRVAACDRCRHPHATQRAAASWTPARRPPRYTTSPRWQVGADAGRPRHGLPGPLTQAAPALPPQPPTQLHLSPRRGFYRLSAVSFPGLLVRVTGSATLGTACPWGYGLPGTRTLPGGLWRPTSAPAGNPRCLASRVGRGPRGRRSPDEVERSNTPATHRR